MTIQRQPNTIPIKWLKLDKFCDVSGETEDSIQARRVAGEWLDSIHVQKRGGRLYVNLEAYHRWVEHGLSRKEQTLIGLRKRRKAATVKEVADAT